MTLPLRSELSEFLTSKQSQPAWLGYFYKYLGKILDCLAILIEIRFGEELSILTKGGVTAMIVIGQNKKRL